MEEKHITLKHEKGYIAIAMISKKGDRWIADFIEKDKDEDNNPIRHRLTLQRGNGNPPNNQQGLEVEFST